MERLRRRFPHTLVLTFDPAHGASSGVPAAALDSSRSDHEIALDFLREVRGSAATDTESGLLPAATEACRTGTETDTRVAA